MKKQLKGLVGLALAGLAACQGNTPADDLNDELTRDDLLVAAQEPGLSTTDSGKVVGVAALPENFQEILDTYKLGGVVWSIRRDEVLSDPAETRFLIDNLVLAMFEQARAAQRAQSSLSSTTQLDAALKRTQSELVACGAPAAEALAEVLAVGDDFFAKMAEDVLGRMGAEAAPAVAELLGRDKAVVRYRALNAIGRLPSARDFEPQVRDRLREVLANDPSEIVRNQAATTLGERGLFAQSGLRLEQADFRSWARALEVGLDDKSESVRKSVLNALGFLGERSSVPAIIAAGRSGTGLDRTEARKALESLTGQRFGLDWDAWTAWWERTEEGK